MGNDDEARRQRQLNWQELGSFREGNIEVNVIRTGDEGKKIQTYAVLEQNISNSVGGAQTRQIFTVDMLRFELLVERARKLAEESRSRSRGDDSPQKSASRLGAFEEGDIKGEVLQRINEKGERREYLNLYRKNAKGETEQFVVSLERAASIRTRAQAVEQQHDQSLLESRSILVNHSVPQVLEQRPTPQVRKPEQENFLNVVRLKDVPTEGDTLATAKVVASLPIAYDVKLLRDLEHVHEIPKWGKQQLVVADVKGKIYVRVWDSQGDRFIDTDEKHQPERAEEIHSLGMYLQGEWPEKVSLQFVVEAVRKAVGQSMKLFTEADARRFADKDPNFALWPKASAVEQPKDATFEVTRELLENHRDKLGKLETQINATVERRKVETEHYVVGLWNDQSMRPEPEQQVKWDSAVQANGRFKDFHVSLTGSERTPGAGEDPPYVLVRKDEGSPPRHRIKAVFQKREDALAVLPVFEKREQELSVQRRQEQEADRLLLTRHRI